MHPTVKPVALVADAIKDCSKRGSLALDPFCGSGTILIAAEKTGRRARAIEIDPVYVDVAIRRWQYYTGKSARMPSTRCLACRSIDRERRPTAPDRLGPPNGEILGLAAAAEVVRHAVIDMIGGKPVHLPDLGAHAVDRSVSRVIERQRLSPDRPVHPAPCL
jgi:hypothetical protein